MSDRRIYPDDLAARIKPGKPYCPSNGTEGDMFYELWCADCTKDADFLESVDNQGCEVLSKSMLFDVKDDEYPKEWTHDENGQPCCTAFEEVVDGE